MPAPGVDRPPVTVLHAFGLAGTPVRLRGGQERSWRVGHAVLKPLDGPSGFIRWQGNLLTRLDGRDDFRVSPPLLARTGWWSAHGWTAWRFEPGEYQLGRWLDIIGTGEAFNAAVRDEPVPDVLQQRTDRWAVADRVAWGELPAPGDAGNGVLLELFAALKPLSLRRQLIHGDLTGNVLFHPDLPPLIIDLSPYWRPPGFASAVVAADALVWHAADERLVEPLLSDEAFPQLLLRALIYRVVSDLLAAPSGHLQRATDPFRAVAAFTRTLAEQQQRR